MFPTGTARPDDRLQDNWPEFLKEVQEVAAQNLKGKVYLYKTDATNLGDTYLNSLDKEGRQHYNCNACLSFLSHFGGLVVIDKNLNTIPVFWSANGSKQAFFTTAVEQLYKAVKNAKIIGVGFNQDSEWNLKLQVKTGKLTQTFVIDRYE